MTHVQATSHIGWWDHNAVGVLPACRLEVAFFFPGLVPLAFDSMGLVGFIHSDCWLSLAAPDLGREVGKMNKNWVAIIAV